MPPMLIYTPLTTERIKYIFDCVLHDALGLNYTITNSPEEFILSELPKFSYADEALSAELFFKQNGLLQEAIIHEINPEFFRENGNAFLFPVQNGALNFDIFSACFYLLSRYEEYLPFEADAHGRFPASQSYALKNNFLEEPVVDQWIMQLTVLLKQQFPSLMIKKRSYSFVPSIDVDQAFAIKEKGWLRQTGAIIKLIIKGQWHSAAFNTKVLKNKQSDPNDTFTYLDTIHKAKAIYFFLIAKHGRLDKNNSLNSVEFKSLIKSRALQAEIGLHPSYASNSNVKDIRIEKERLEKIIGKKVISSRQHFLKLRLPHTYRSLIAAGFTNEYSMGYADRCGFRAGTCLPFYFYDLDQEQITNLQVHPFAVMDVTLKDYLQLGPEQAIEYIAVLNAKVRSVNGTFITLWHNESLSEYGIWRGWRKVYDELIRISDHD